MLALIASVAFVAAQIPDTPVKPSSGTWAYGNCEIDYKIEWTLVSSSKVELDACRNVCNGKKHFRHEDCDLSCDTPCKKKHVIDWDAYYLPMVPAPEVYKQRGKEFWEAVQKIGGSLTPEWPKDAAPDFEAAIKALSKPAEKDPKNGVHLKLQHWNTAPCSTSFLVATEYKWQSAIDWQVFRIEKGPDDRKIRVAGPKDHWLYGELYTDSYDKDQKPEVYESCRCKTLLTPDEAHYRELSEEHEKRKELEKKKQIEEKTPKPEEVPGPKDGHGSLIGPEDLQKFKIEPICTDMNEIVIRCENTLPYAVDVCCDPGTICECEDDAYQDVIFIMPFLMHLEPAATSTFTLSLAHGPAVLGEVKEAKGQIACISMHKREPNKNVKFHFATRYDMDLARLCAMSKDEFINTNVQPRIWVYTDHPSYDDMAKLLFPRPTPGQYMDVCYDVAKVGHANLLDSEYAPCVNPDLLSGKGRVRPQAAAWYCDVCEKSDPAKLAASISAHAMDFAALLSPGIDERTVQRVAATLGRLVDSDNKEVALAGAKALAAIPPEQRGAIMLSGALSGACVMLKSQDPKVCSAAMDIVDLFGYGPAYPFLKDLEAPTPELKARAAEICKKLIA